MKEPINCGICGKFFTPRSGKEKTCSRSCSAKLRERNKKAKYKPEDKGTWGSDVAFKNRFILRPLTSR